MGKKYRKEVICLFICFAILSVIVTFGEFQPTLSGEERSQSPNVSFPPTGIFETHMLPTASRFQVAPNGELFIYLEKIYSSMDEGYQWSAIQTSVHWSNITTLGFSPDYNEDQIMFAGLNYGTDPLWFSSNGGKSWDKPADSMLGPVEAIALSPNYSQDGVVYVGTSAYNGKYLLRSGDEGWHWEVISLPNPSIVKKIQFSPNYEVDRRVFFLTEAGEFWYLDESIEGERISASIPEAVDYYVKDFAISPNFAQDKRIFIGTDAGFFASYDGGQTWMNKSLQSMGQILIAPDYGSSGEIFANTGQIIRTTDDGVEWETLYTGDNIYGMGFSPEYASDNTLYLLTPNVFYTSKNRGLVWDVTSRGLEYREHWLETIQLSDGFEQDGVIFAGPRNNVAGTLYKSNDAGLTWATLPLPESGEFIFTISGDFSIDQTVFVAFENRLWRSTNGGQNWVRLAAMPLYLPIALITSPNFSSDQTLFTAVDFYGVYRSQDGGDTWQNINEGLPSEIRLSIAVSPGYPQDPTLFAFSGNAVYRSDNGGDNWTLAGVPGMINIFVLEFSSSFPEDGTLFVSSTDGIYRSTDRGQTWEEISGEPYPSETPALAVSPRFSEDKTLIAGRAVGSLYISEDAGDHWHVLQGIPASPVFDEFGVDIGYRSGKIAPIASVRGGIYRYRWPEPTSMIPSLIQAFVQEGHTQFITQTVRLQVEDRLSPGYILSDNAEWLEIEPISGTLPANVGFIFDTQGLVDELSTNVSANLYWSINHITQDTIQVRLVYMEDRLLLPIIYR